LLALGSDHFLELLRAEKFEILFLHIGWQPVELNTFVLSASLLLLLSDLRVAILLKCRFWSEHVACEWARASGLLIAHLDEALPYISYPTLELARNDAFNREVSLLRG